MQRKVAEIKKQVQKEEQDRQDPVEAEPVSDEPTVGIPEET